MRHLFIVNPVAENVRGWEKEIIGIIQTFFSNQPDIDFDIYVTRYSRDAVGYIKQYAATTRELIRIYAVGGTGTLFEVVNGAIGHFNIQIAAYPLGRCNDFVRYFGKDNHHNFHSLRSLATSNTMPLDVIRCGNNYAINFCAIGMEADATMRGDNLLIKAPFLGDICYLSAGVYSVLRSPYANQKYCVTLDGEVLDGNYFTIWVANGPCYGIDLSLAVDAHPNDGHFDVYMGVGMSRFKMLSAIFPYSSGNYRKIPDIIKHYTGHKLEVSSDSIMCIVMDGEIFYDEQIDFEIIPKALDFVCPSGIDINKLPRIYGAKEGG